MLGNNHVMLQALQYTGARAMALKDHVMTTVEEIPLVARRARERYQRRRNRGCNSISNQVIRFTFSLLHDFADDDIELESIMSLL
jgi:hypothetical protein